MNSFRQTFLLPLLLAAGVLAAVLLLPTAQPSGTEKRVPLSPPLVVEVTAFPEELPEPEETPLPEEELMPKATESPAVVPEVFSEPLPISFPEVPPLPVPEVVVRVPEVPKEPVEEVPLPQVVAAAEEEQSAAGSGNAGGIYGEGEVEEPPVALDRIQPVYPPYARRRNLGGSVLLRFVVDEGGHVGDVEVLSADPSGYGFEDSARTALCAVPFRAARHLGKVVPCRMELPVVFRIQQ